MVLTTLLLNDSVPPISCAVVEIILIAAVKPCQDVILVPRPVNCCRETLILVPRPVNRCGEILPRPNSRKQVGFSVILSLLLSKTLIFI